MNLRERLNPRRSLSARLILVNLSVILLALVGMVLAAGYRLQLSTIAEAERELELRTLLIANALREPVHNQLSSDDEGESGDENEKTTGSQAAVAVAGRDLSALVNSYAADIDGRVTVLDSSLRVRYSSDANVPLFADDARPEIKAALDGWEQHDIRLDEWSGEERLFVAAPIGSEDSTEGIVQVSVPMAHVLSRVNRLWFVLASAGLSLALLALLATLLLANHLTRPLRTLTRAANVLASGDMSVRLDLDRQDEVGTLAAAFDNMAEQISQLVARERSFVANASHELRSPLTSIQLRAELLQRIPAGDPDRVRRYLHDIEQEAAQLGRLLQRLLDLNRIQSAPAQVVQSTPPTPSWQRVIALFQPIAAAAGISLQVDIPDDLPALPLDGDEWELIARNLIDNAIKFTPAGGSVRVAAYVHENQLAFCVQDTGHGIAAADLPHLFERFYQADKGHRQSGSGLGLSFVQEIVARHHGAITVDSQLGQGASFTVTLPLPPGTRHAAQPV